MNRENLQAKLQDIPELELEDRVEAYEDLFDEVDIEAVERFEDGNGEKTIAMEVKRRIWILYKITDDLDLKPLAERSLNLLEDNF